MSRCSLSRYVAEDRLWDTNELRHVAPRIDGCDDVASVTTYLQFNSQGPPRLKIRIHSLLLKWDACMYYKLRN